MKKLMAANWKMHKTQAEARSFVAELMEAIQDLPEDREVVVFAPFTALSVCAPLFMNKSGFFLGAQNVYPAANGAFTGEISPVMLCDAGCGYVLAGHSERRALMHEDNEFIGKKTAFAVSNGLKTVLCVGENLWEREAGRLEEVLTSQLDAGLASVSDAVSPDFLAIAYEPVWAIGTGKVAGSAEIVETHALVRTLLIKRFPNQGSRLRILYGGSVKPENSSEIIALDNVDGVLVGGASLDAQNMRKIVLA